MKKIISVLLVVVMSLSVFAFVSCGKKGDKTSDGKTIIRMAHWDQGGYTAEEEPLKLIKEEFEKTHPEYALEYTIYSGYESQFLNIMASGSIPDVFLVPDGDFGTWVSTGLMQDLTGYINASAKKDELAEIFESAMSRYKYNGKTLGIGSQYCLPKDIGPYVMFYNKDLFKQFGIYEEYKEYLEGTVPMDINDAIDMWSVFASIDGKGETKEDHVYGIDGITIEGLAWSNGADWFNEDRTQLTLKDNTKLAEAYDMYKTLYDLKIAPDAESGAGISLFYQGKTACYVGLRANVPNLRMNCDFDWDCCAIPAFDTNPYCNSWSGSVGYGVYSKSKHKQAAYDVIELIASRKGQLLIASTGFAIPFYDDKDTLDTFYQLEKDGGKPANTQAFIEAAKYQRSNRLTYLPGSFRWKSQIDLASSDIFEKNLNKRLAIDTWLSNMQDEIGTILATDYPMIFGKK